ncbi:hypothetical protein BDE27_0896 [Xenorhabdus ehlersii]|uniref:Uncharacterized protein n=1 Tax=Xenorhabdus ehlersii TaxID=290111 RepID=A0A2D0IXI7_9GAMM|nr:hypothetical protein Xehl_00333 [Xenorhabdus ehlersii]RKE93185.1 hypothetical protein BDE27_0896 [Xenorhabdus ehlersii]
MYLQVTYFMISDLNYLGYTPNALDYILKLLLIKFKFKFKFD